VGIGTTPDPDLALRFVEGSPVAASVVFRRGARALASMLLFSTFGWGCASTWVGLRLSNTQFTTEGSRETVTPLGGGEERLEIEPLSLDPLRLTCRFSTRGPRELVRETWSRYAYNWKVITIAAFVIEASAATGLFLVPRQNPEFRGRATMYTFGAIFAADALGTAILHFALSPESGERSFERSGVWTTVASCPDGMTIDDGPRRLRVGADGWPEADGPSILGQALVLQGAPLQMRWRDRMETLRATPEQRCGWAREHGGQAPADCPRSPWPSSAAPPPRPPASLDPRSAPPPLPGGLRLRIDFVLPIPPVRAPPR
jgi:hypothetical protein